MKLEITPSWQNDPDIAQTVEGQNGQLVTADLSVTDLLRLVVIELRRLNVQLSMLTNEEVKDHDIERVD
jgi:hypothetical protein